eukprot:EG_transcript_36547
MERAFVQQVGTDQHSGKAGTQRGDRTAPSRIISSAICRSLSLRRFWMRRRKAICALLDFFRRVAGLSFSGTSASARRTSVCIAAEHVYSIAQTSPQTRNSSASFA